MASTSKSVSGRPLRGQAREIVYNVARFFKKQKEQHNMDMNIATVTSEATGVSERLVNTVLKEGKQSLERGELSFSTPKGKKVPKKQRINVDTFTDSAIRQKIREFYAVKKECPSLRKLLNSLKEDDVIDCGREFLRKRIKKMGFKWKKCQSNRKILVERPDIAVWRTRYLHEIKKHRREGKNIVYVDETYVQQSHSVKSCWQSEQESGTLTKMGAGQRLIIVHGGGEEGFVDGALLIFKSGQKTGDYHSSMNSENYCKWLKNEILPKLESPSVIVMDNAKYHNVEIDKKPTSTSTRSCIVDWLTRHGVTYNDSATRSELLQLARNVQHEKRYIVNELIMEHGHLPLRLPPYHPDLNPIELVWGDIKGEVARHVIGSSLQQKEQLLKKLFNEYSREKWNKCCEHVKKIENKYCEQECSVDSEVNNIIISLSSGYDASSDTSSSSSDMDTDADW